MNQKIESQGKTVEEAVSEALLKLGARKSEVDVEVLEEGKSGFLGMFGNRPARVLVSLKARPTSARRTGRSRGGQRGQDGQEGRDRTRSRNDRKPDGSPPARSRQGDNRSNQRSRPPSQARPQQKPKPRPMPAARPEPRQTPVADAQPGNIREEAAGISAISRVQPLSGFKPDEIPSGLESIANELMSRSGFACRCEVKQGEYHAVKLITDDSSAGILIGRRGSTVDAIEHLVERMASHAAGDRVHMNLDINNYRRRRQDSLIEHVHEIMTRVGQSGREEHLEPLSARERRLVHMEVAKKADLRTFTIMNSSGKHVVVARAEAEPESSESKPSTADVPRNDQADPGGFSEES